jgi:D-alanyl-D-alanine carboxypeptidase (penicillin-binding protein 5/6)
MKKVLQKDKISRVKKNTNVWLLSLFVIFLSTTLIYFNYNFKVNIAADKIIPISQYQHPLIPVASDNTSVPILTASNYILVDVDTNTIILGHHLSDRIFPASVTKLATALTALNIYPLEEVIKIGATYPDGKVMKLQSNEEITVRSLVTALLVYSANDAAYNLALHHRDGIPGFIREMNLIAGIYNLKNTHFVNFDGIHDPNHYSTVYDLSQLGRLAIKNPVIRETVKNKTITVSDISGKISHQLETTNELLGVVPEIEGLKTGWTPEARGCFVGLINLNGHYLISVVAASDDRFVDTTKLIDWAKQNIIWQPYTP